MANAQERSLLRQLIDGYIDKNEYDRKISELRSTADTPEAKEERFNNSNVKYTVPGQGYLTLEGIEQEQRNKLKESLEQTGDIDINTAKTAQADAQAKIDYMLSDEYREDLEQDRLDKIKEETEATGGMPNVDRMQGIQATHEMLTGHIDDAKQRLDARGSDTPIVSEYLPIDNQQPGDGEQPPGDVPPPVVEEEEVVSDNLYGRLGGQIWNIDGLNYIVFDIPQTSMHMAYTATDEQIDNFFTVDKPAVQTFDFNSEQWSSSYLLGNIVEVDVENMEVSGVGGFFEQIVSNFDKVKETRPWMENDEMYSLWLESIVENREIADYEWEGTEWWQTHSQEERDWLLLSQGKDLSTLPKDAEQLLKNNAIRAKEVLRQNGVSNPDDVTFNGQSLTDWFGNKLTTGTWTELQWLNQAKGLGDPLSGIQQEQALTDWLNGSAKQPETTQAGYATARALAEEWLGPLYGTFEQADIDKYASMIRNAESEEVGIQQVQDSLKNIRKVLFTTDTYDENLTYEEIAQPWRNFSFQLLGERIDETSTDWIEVLNANDQQEANKLLTTYGLNKGNETIMDKVTDDIGSFLGVGPQTRGIVRGQST
jgi:hypothetical protein